jgi:hypothetical protein
MSSNLPIYDMLYNEFVDISDDLTTKQKDEFLKKVKLLDSNGHELIYAIIRVYQLENSEDKNTYTIPFHGKFIKNDLKFDLNDLPNKLKRMIYKFTDMHIKSMKEKSDADEEVTNNTDDE